MDKQTKLVALTEDQQSALQAICRRRKAGALVWKRAQAFLLMDAGYDAKTICENLVPLFALSLTVYFANCAIRCPAVHCKEL